MGVGQDAPLPAPFARIAGCGLFVGGALRLDQRPAGRGHDPRDHRPQPLRGGHKAMWHASWGGLPAPEFLEAVDPLLGIFRGHLYSDTVTGDACVGRLCGEWAARLGLKPGIAVGVGAIDCHVGAVGAGIVPGTLVKVMGTSTCDIVSAPTTRSGDRTVRGICGQVDGSVLPGYIGFEAGQAAFGDLVRLVPAGDGVAAAADCRKRSTARRAVLGELTAEAERAAPDTRRSRALDCTTAGRTPDADPGCGVRWTD